MQKLTTNHPIASQQTEQRDGASICIAVCSVLMAIPALIGS